MALSTPAANSDPPWQRGNPPLTGSPVTRRQVEQGVLEIVILQPLGHIERWVIVGKKVRRLRLPWPLPPDAPETVPR